jgi:hypothetical protein
MVPSELGHGSAIRERQSRDAVYAVQRRDPKTAAVGPLTKA